MSIIQFFKDEIKDMFSNKFAGAIITICFLMAIGSCSSCMWKKDNPLEEFMEDVIEEKTGIEIDLSPEFHEPGGISFNIHPFSNEEKQEIFVEACFFF